MRNCVWIVCLVLFVVAAFVQAAEKVTVESVKGPAQYCNASAKEAKWIALKKGDKLGDTTVIRTGFGSRVVLHFRDDTRVTITGASKMGIREFRGKGKVTKTSLGLKYGVIKAEVDSTRNANDFKVKVHNTTLAVTGTKGIISGFVDLGAWLFSTEHTWRMTNNNGEQNIPEGGQGNQGLEHGLVGKGLDTQQGDTGGGLGAAYQWFLRMLGFGRGGVFEGWSGDPTRVPQGFRGGPPPSGGQSFVGFTTTVP
jgi:hypothetical protein